jgi:hypothetical protein
VIVLLGKFPVVTVITEKSYRELLQQNQVDPDERGPFLCYDLPKITAPFLLRRPAAQKRSSTCECNVEKRTFENWDKFNQLA